ncbi:MAG: RecQ family ATP-dependent DNA helicase [Bacteroidales bacterium]|nr:RecQ family ATP-dependent DNA helicase [Bacteroidales bacterium]
MNKNEGLELLRKALNDSTAEFREGQWEAIDSLVNYKRKLLVVERTGWGKSSVYFISTRILRDQGKGITIIISPLLALMRNQVEAAERLGIIAISINSSNLEDWENSKQDVLNNKVDALLISPERLANENFMNNILRPIADRIGLFVVDEAHCISDWGHDFRPDYRRIVNILKFMPEGMPILGTTATANNRVSDDIVSQLGDIEIIRGVLTRESLILQNIKLQDQASRLAWLKQNIQNLPGSGIIYTLTKRDARLVTEWLIDCDIEAAYYYSGATDENFEDSNQYRQYVEDALYNNEIKVLVATTALGMGYDKPDLGFVVHYQAPGSIISYYQQVGRAGRAIRKAYGILLSGQEDSDIHAYFRQSAFPPEDRVQAILDKIEEEDGLSVPELMKYLNLRKGQIEQVLKYLSVEESSPIIKIGPKWTRTAVDYKMDSEKITRLTNQRLNEWQDVEAYISTTDCLMNYLQKSLDDPKSAMCGKCANCRKQERFSVDVLHENVVNAAIFLKHSEFDIKLKVRIESDALSEYGFRGNLSQSLRGEVGKSLSRWGDAGWGKIVAQDKHNNHFRDELVDAFVEMINERWNMDPIPTWVTCIPSNRHPDLVSSFAKRVADKLGLPFIPVIDKLEETAPQKEQENSYFQCENLDGIFEINDDVKVDEPVLLIDDIIDSGWTLTIASALLRQSGSGLVYPTTLTSTSVN